MTEKITKTQLKEDFGWTETLIKRFYPVPVLTKKSYISGRTYSLYEVDIVQQVEETEEFKQAQKKSRKRSQAALEQAQKRESNLLREIDDLLKQIEIPKVYDLKREALDSYNQHQHSIDSYHITITEEDAPRDFIERICLNYVRHCLTDYEYYLHLIKGKVGVRRAHDILKEAINAKTCLAHPKIFDP